MAGTISNRATRADLAMAPRINKRCQPPKLGKLASSPDLVAGTFSRAREQHERVRRLARVIATTTASRRMGSFMCSFGTAAHGLPKRPGSLRRQSALSSPNAAASARRMPSCSGYTLACSLRYSCKALCRGERHAESIVVSTVAAKSQPQGVAAGGDRPCPSHDGRGKNQSGLGVGGAIRSAPAGAPQGVTYD